ncbi:hypothetical protein NLG97_g3835 [Lecanicillium saksenae]|uniref:Uncharacterized protein n=1 Tax=Lecanicillium saksenae TaxID=468837 RepID=A0ACC1QWY7_9HYPO|nr:hypothetical protein NLG97_g3835 [Lecanicillium saksenae]
MQSGPADLDLRPTTALQNEAISTLFFHYMQGPATWYDLCDPQRHFAEIIPQLALQNELLFSAIIALSAVQRSRTSAKSLREVPGFYHERCVRLLIQLRDGDESLRDGTALSAACLLRSYEILNGNHRASSTHNKPTNPWAEDVDPNTHLQGAFSLASHEAAVAEAGGNELLAAGFWNYLREDITFSLFQGCPLKIDLVSIQAPTFRSGESHLHSISLILGDIINKICARQATEFEWRQCYNTLDQWLVSLPQRLFPFSTIHTATDVFPQIRFLQDYHASAMHYSLVASCILIANGPPSCEPDILNNNQFNRHESITLVDVLERVALDICGIAFTTNIPSVLVNAYGPISYCGKYIRDEGAQDELMRQLHASGKLTGWPVARLIDSLKSTWADA